MSLSLNSFWLLVLLMDPFRAQSMDVSAVLFVAIAIGWSLKESGIGRSFRFAVRSSNLPRHVVCPLSASSIDHINSLGCIIRSFLRYSH